VKEKLIEMMCELITTIGYPGIVNELKRKEISAVEALDFLIEDIPSREDVKAFESVLYRAHALAIKENI